MAQRILSVGPDQTYKTPRDAYAAASRGDIIEIDADGVYFGEDAKMHIKGVDNVCFRGVGGTAKMEVDREDPLVAGKGIWLLGASNIVFENIEFCGANLDRDKNGAGIRVDPDALESMTVRNCYFHHNNNGILGGTGEIDILIEHSTFEYNGYGDGYSHNMYISHARSFTLRFCYVRSVNKGHLVKSRALNNHILYNRITHESDFGFPWMYNNNLDIPDGGNAYIVGNLFHMGRNAGNHCLFSYAKENMINPGKTAYVVNNTFVNESEEGCFTWSPKEGYSIVTKNNLFVGKPVLNKGVNEFGDIHNLHVKTDVPCFQDINFAFPELKDRAKAMGVDQGEADGVSLVPVHEYGNRCRKLDRPVSAEPAIGAYHY